MHRGNSNPILTKEEVLGLVGFLIVTAGVARSLSDVWVYLGGIWLTKPFLEIAFVSVLAGSYAWLVGLRGKRLFIFFAIIGEIGPSVAFSLSRDPIFAIPVDHFVLRMLALLEWGIYAVPFTMAGGWLGFLLSRLVARAFEGP